MYIAGNGKDSMYLSLLDKFCLDLDDFYILQNEKFDHLQFGLLNSCTQ